MKHGTVRVVHYDEISAGGSVSGRETDPSGFIVSVYRDR